MGEIGAARKYLYWSDRRIRAIANDNGIKFQRNTRSVYRSPSAPVLPQAEIQVESLPWSRHDIAERVRSALGALVVSDFVTPPPVQFAEGHGTIILSEFCHWGTDQPPGAMAAIETTMSADDDRPVAVCLFGSLANFADFITDAIPPSRGWTSSSAPAVMRSLASRLEEFPKGNAHDEQRKLYRSELPADQLANEAAKIAFRQGQSSDNTPDWKRGFAYGQVNDVGEWLAEVYLDVEFPTKHYADLACWGRYHRVIVGAPLWISTPTIRDVLLYDEYTPREMKRRRK